MAKWRLSKLGRTSNDRFYVKQQTAQVSEDDQGVPYDALATIGIGAEETRLYPQFSSSIGSEEADQPASLQHQGLKDRLLDEPHPRRPANCAQP